jgi:hypothetical protein
MAAPQGVPNQQMAATRNNLGYEEGKVNTKSGRRGPRMSATMARNRSKTVSHAFAIGQHHVEKAGS